MKLYLVTDQDGVKLWVAADYAEDVFCYVHQTGKFHRNSGLRADFYMDRELRYQPIGVTEARQLIDQGIGSIASEEAKDVLDRFRADSAPLDVDVVFAAAIADTSG